MMDGGPMRSVPLMPAVKEADLVVIVTDHKGLPWGDVVESARAVVDTRNATRGLKSPKIVRL
jgi:UDP-N-acetyl-D-glucosamine dehydrogenase